MLAQAKQRDKQLAKMEEEGLIADPDAKSDEATIALSFPPPPPLKKPLLASLDGASFRYPTPDGTLAKGAPLLRELRLSVSLGERIGVLGRRSRVAESGRAAGRTSAVRGPPPANPSPPGPLLHAHSSTRPTRGQQAALSTPSRLGRARTAAEARTERAPHVLPSVLCRPNGAGKSTLLHLLTQQLQPTSGDAWLNRGAKWAIFAQHHIDQLDLSASPQDFLASKFAGASPHCVHANRVHTTCTPHARCMHTTCTLLCSSHARTPHPAHTPFAHRMHTACTGAKEVEIRSRLGRFGIENQHAWQPMSKLSGGQKSRIVLCAISWAEPTFLILDE